MTNEPGIVVLATAAEMITAEVRRYGQLHRETGGFLMLPRDTATVSTIAFAGTTGILRRHNLFQISERALDQLFIFADDHDLHVPVQFHSHEFGAFLSPTDIEHGLRVDGFISVVIPTYTAPPSDVRRWGWWRFSAGAWAATIVPPTRDGPVTAVWFDEEGIHAT